jgi:hypothetical protein
MTKAVHSGADDTESTLDDVSEAELSADGETTSEGALSMLEFDDSSSELVTDCAAAALDDSTGDGVVVVVTTVVELGKTDVAVGVVELELGGVEPVPSWEQPILPTYAGTSTANDRSCIVTTRVRGFATKRRRVDDLLAEFKRFAGLTRSGSEWVASWLGTFHCDDAVIR